MSARQDPGLHAVARVRGVREQDSRLGLQHALRDEQERGARLHRLETSLAAAPGFVSGDARELAAVRLSQAALGQAVAEARRDLAAARTMTLDATTRWHSDRTRLSAVEGLLERRADERRSAARRVEATALDDIAGQRWLRARRSAS